MIALPVYVSVCVCCGACLCFFASAPLEDGEPCLRRAQSQGKLWWRLVAILTGKSFVALGERDERLIEPSGSWFPPQFPSE